MSSKKQELLKTLTMKELKEVCKNNGLKGYSQYKRNELAKFVAENTNLSIKQIENLVNKLQEDKMATKVKDSGDFILRKAVKIESNDPELIIASVDSLKLKIYNLGTPEFSYLCDGKCKDYIYRVKQGQSPFCKHYPAVIAELILQGKLDPSVTIPNHISGKSMDALNEILEKRKKEDGAIISEDRNIENTLKSLKEDLMEISCKNSVLAREKYHETPEKVFKTMIDDSFQLLEYETILNRRNEGWDLLVLGTYAPKPYIAVVDCKPASLGTYNFRNNSNPMITLKSYCTDMCKEQLMGVYKDYVKYMVIVAPDFPEEITQFVPQFTQITGGIKLSFLPVSTLLYLVECYRENPILTHYNSETLFKKDIITKEDVDELFKVSEEHIAELCTTARSVLRSRMTEICQHHTDACYIKLDEVFLQQIIEEVISILNPHLLKQGVNGTTGIKTFSLNHDYYLLWEKVLNALTEEFANILKEQSLLQIKRSDLKEDIIKYLE
ncbi:Rho termination factor N-terminal domain-containing protein [Methanobacterium sp.]|uniref:Rho termination factor N-terminal domain-containing protein n=1 Tax=Methanobacterium sp. TaxID=2164 RepID=UPI003158C26C